MFMFYNSKVKYFIQFYLILSDLIYKKPKSEYR